MRGPIASRFQISEGYRGLTGIERYCREECNRTEPSSEEPA